MIQRKNITQPADWWQAFEQQAKAEGYTLSEWIGECCLAYVPQDKANKLSARPAVGKPAKSTKI